jgi:hypothetical protein
VEISCIDPDNGRPVHILCYFPEKPDRLMGMLSQILTARTKASRRMIQAVTRFYPVTEELILRHSAGSKAVYRTHILQALMDLGYAVTLDDLWHKLLGFPDGLCYCRSEYYPEVRDAVKTVRRAGGIAVMAHPLSYNSLELLNALAGEGLLHGIEVYHPDTSEEDSANILAPIAEKYGLIQTGGSDFHGFLRGRPCPLASRITAEKDIGALFKLRDSISSS